MLYHKLIRKCDEETIHQMFKEAVEIEREFICESLPCRLIGMNSDLMTQYIYFIADILIKNLGYKTIYNTTNPFKFMDNLGSTGKTNFFEERVTEYSKAYSTSNISDRVNVSLDDDF